MTTDPPTSALRLFAYLTAAAAVLTILADVVTYVTMAPIAGVAVVVLLGAPLAFTVRVWGTVTAVLAGLLALLGGPALAEYSWIPVLGWLLIGGLVAGTNTLTMRRLAAVAAED